MGRWAVFTLILVVCVWGGTFAAFFVGYRQLPERVPIHFNAEGVADGWTERDRLLPIWMIIPGFTFFVAMLAILLPRLGPSLVAGPKMKGKFEYVLFLAGLLMCLVQTLVITSSFGVKFDFGRIILSAIFAFFGLLGLSMRGLPRNPVMGIRLPWTMRSEAVWEATHRFASRLYITAGGIGAASAAAGLLSNPAGVLIAIICLFLFAAIVPIAYSLVAARRIEGRTR